MNYPEILERITLFYDVLEVELRRKGALSAKERESLKDSILILNSDELEKYRENFEKTKHLTSLEIEEIEAKIDEPDRFVVMNGLRNHILDFNLDKNSLEILNGKEPKPVKEISQQINKNIIKYKP